MSTASSLVACQVYITVIVASVTSSQPCRRGASRRSMAAAAPAGAARQAGGRVGGSGGDGSGGTGWLGRGLFVAQGFHGLQQQSRCRNSDTSRKEVQGRCSLDQ